MKRLSQLAIILLVSSLSFAGQLIGRIVTPSSAGVRNGTLSFTQSQAGVVAGTFAVTTTPADCYTDSTGAVVGAPDPLIAPIVTPSAASGTLAAGTYYVVITYYTGVYETYYSPETTVVLGAPGHLTISAPLVQPANATGYKVYISTTSGAELLQGTNAGWGSFTQSSALLAGASLPASNATVCSLIFNDSIIPSLTSYSMNVRDRSGRQVSGYPQDFYFFGNTVDLSSFPPLGNIKVRFPNAIIAQPTGNATQSISGPLDLTNYNVTAKAFISNGAQGTVPVSATSTTPAHLTVDGLGATITRRTTNAITETADNPSAIRTYHIPDCGAANCWYVMSTSNGMDCTSSLTCTYTDHLRWQAATCVNTTATTMFSSFATNAGIAACNGAATFQQGILTFKAAINLEKTTTGQNGAGAGTVVSAAWGSNTTAANILIATIGFVNNAGQTVTGVANGGDAFVLAKACANGTAIRSEIWYAMNIAGGTTTAVTATFSAAAVGTIQVHEYSGALTAGALDAAVCSSGTSTDPASGATGVLATNPELIIGGLALAATGVSGIGVTNAGATGHGGIASASTAAIFSSGVIAQATTTQTFTYHLNSSKVYAIALASFKPSVSVAAASVQRSVDMTSDWAGPVTVRQLWYPGPLVAVNPTFSTQTTTGAVLSSAVGCIVADQTAAGEGSFNTATATTTQMVSGGSGVWTTTTNSALDLTGCTPGTPYMMQMKFARERTMAGDTFDGPVNVVTYDISHLRNQ